ncbi:peptidoglycan DD-metalloendopeptidase family protein [Flavihumibacter sp. CACIAM 22H1]|uniref:peptidoglycan DD-metalloendopeptidase family protein n=1 Tax=Flavihumibacter sp. CACIAM 22H1 TaxID=1812911 RepID=UPI0007A818C4|nr:peptidoglycan DD-metalloendopeptidase family protein [Flavihumibacter sp. CACIAM 22H1]KYP16431.1 MAG: peptidase M23 [Flavihumibacter sp. CACIAM 22H1]
MTDLLIASLLRNQSGFHPVVSFDPGTDRLALLDLTREGDLLPGIAARLEEFQLVIEQLRLKRGATYLIGGYNELREIYSRSELFEAGEEPRRLHIGIDIWGPAGTQVFAFMGGMVHSLGWNDRLGDYGATIILLHQLDGIPFYTLYGHLSKADIDALSPGQYINRGQLLAHFGAPAENGQWPPHLHFQLIRDIGLYSGDYPGVVQQRQRDLWLQNCPDPDLILQLNKFL